MLGGYNITPLVECLKNENLAEAAVAALSNTLLIFDAFNEINELAKSNDYAKKVLGKLGRWQMVHHKR